MSDKTIEVSKIVIKIGETETTLTVEQAKELKAVLVNLLGDGQITWYPYPYSYPKIWYGDYWTVSNDLDDKEPSSTYIANTSTITLTN